MIQISNLLVKENDIVEYSLTNPKEIMEIENHWLAAKIVINSGKTHQQMLNLEG